MKKVILILVAGLLLGVNANSDEVEINDRLKKIEERLNKLEKETSLGDLSNLLKNSMSNYKKLEKETEKLTEAKKNYIKNNLKLFEVEAKYVSVWGGSEDTPGVKFSIKNLGNKTLSKIRVVVYFLDKNGKPFAEDDYLPVLEGSISGISSSFSSLKPNYTFRMDDSTFYTKDNLGDEWSGKIKIEISYIEFDEKN